MRNSLILGSGLRVLGLCLTLVAVSGCWDPFSSSGGGGGHDDDEGRAVEADLGASGSVSDTASSGDAGDSEDPPAYVVSLDPGRADTRGAAQYRCWDDNCYWVVWCGHKVCDGSWTWTFPSSGDYHITWQAVKEKCAGSPAYEFRINGRTVTSGRIPQYGSCGGCDGSGVFVDRELGSVEFEKGDSVTLWVENDFACGIDGPGAYAAHDALRADLQ